MTRDFKSYEEIANEYDKMKEAGTELDNLVPVKARVAKDLRAVFSFRLSPAELTEIAAAARSRKRSISDFIRTAALAASRDELDLGAGDQAAALLEVRQKTRELSESVSRLTSPKKARSRN
jgi:hypothetical protein